MRDKSTAPAADADAPADANAPGDLAQNAAGTHTAAGRPSLRQRLLGVWCIVLTGLVVGLSAALVLGNLEDERQAPAGQPAAAVDQEPALAIPEPPVESTLEHGDMLLLSGNPREARSVFESVGQQRGMVSGSLAYRIALCDEETGDTNAALSLYRALSEKTEEPNVAAAAKVSQVRIWTKQGKLDLAAELLAPLMLQHDSMSATVLAEATHLFAFLRAQQIAANAQRTILDERCPAAPTIFWSPADCLKLLPGSTVSQPPNPPSPLTLTVESRLSSVPAQTFVSLSAPGSHLVELLKTISSQLDLTAALSQAAKKSISGRSTRIEVQNVNLAVVLDQLLLPFDLTWSYRDRRLEISTAHELTDEQLRAARMQAARRQLNSAIASFPEHRLAPVTMLQLANLAYLNQEIEQAALSYRQLLSQFPRNEVRQEVWFNLGRALRRIDQPAEALAAFWQAIDEAGGGSLESVAYLLVGTMLLEMDQPDEAMRPLLRAVTLATEEETKTAAVLSLASAYLLAENPVAANTTLMKHRKDLPAAAAHDEIAFLSALARFRTSHQHDRQRAGRDALAAISRVQPEDFYGDVGFILLAEACRDLGLSGQMADIYRQGLASELRGVVRDRLTIALADYELEVGNLITAQRLLAALEANGSAAGRDEALYRLAEIAHLQREDAHCLELCQQLLAETANERLKANVMRLMGRTFQRLEMYHEAALCFSGLAPASWTISPDSSEL